MRYVAAYLLAVLGSNQNPKSADLEKILGSVGIEADKEKLNIVMKQLEGKNIDELLKEGLGKLASMPAGGGGGAVASSGDAAPAAEKKEDKKEAKKEESEEEDDDMGFGLFD